MWCSGGVEDNDNGRSSVEKLGVGKLWVSFDWFIKIVSFGKGLDIFGIFVVDVKFEDVKDLFGGVLFLLFFKWMMENGFVYRFVVGLCNFVIVGDFVVVKYVLKGYGMKYFKGLVVEVFEFFFGLGFVIVED